MSEESGRFQIRFKPPARLQAALTLASDSATNSALRDLIRDELIRDFGGLGRESSGVGDEMEFVDEIFG